MSICTKNFLLKIDSILCKGCEICINTCPKHLLKMSEGINPSGFHYAFISKPELCTGCSLCARMCPDMAIEIWDQN